jgi:hypothetical protein
MHVYMCNSFGFFCIHLLTTMIYVRNIVLAQPSYIHRTRVFFYRHIVPGPTQSNLSFKIR